MYHPSRYCYARQIAQAGGGPVSSIHSCVFRTVIRQRISNTYFRTVRSFGALYETHHLLGEGKLYRTSALTSVFQHTRLMTSIVRTRNVRLSPRDTREIDRVIGKFKRFFISLRKLILFVCGQFDKF